MTKNEILRKLRFIFDLNDEAVISIFNSGNFQTDRSQISDWLKKEDDENFKIINDFQLASFLNGIIVNKRGKKDEKELVAETVLNNNIILRKLKIALNLKDEDIIELLQSVDFRISKPEISAFFRVSSHKHYRTCKDQILRNFLLALQFKYRGKIKS